MEILHSDNARIKRLEQYLELLAGGETSKELHDRYKDVLATATAYEVNSALDGVLSRTVDIEAFKVPVSRFLRAVSKALDSEDLPEYPAGHLLARFETENERISEQLSLLQSLVKAVRQGNAPLHAITDFVHGLTLISDHYTALQNELFPLFEAASPAHACVKLMWAIENDVLKTQKQLCAAAGDVDDLKNFWCLTGDFFVLALSLVYREKRVLFPVAFRAVPQSPFTGKPEKATVHEASSLPSVLLKVFTSPTGALGNEELEAIFSVLPVDISFIGADDRVKYYSDPPHRIFPRSPAVVGRLVQNCHPPKSVATVEAILASFKNGSRDSEEFYLSLKGRFILIQYFAIRKTDGTYMGTLEVSQDATEIRALKGEKRLL